MIDGAAIQVMNAFVEPQARAEVCVSPPLTIEIRASAQSFLRVGRTYQTQSKAKEV